MAIIDSILEPTNGYIISFTRNSLKGWWELNVGLPSNWVFDENSDISCEVIFENNLGKVIKISPTNEYILFDDLVAFVEVILETNRKIADKEKQFTDKMDEMKNALEEEAKRFYKELDELKENSFKNLSDNFTNKNLSDNFTKSSEIKKELKPKKIKTTPPENSQETNTSND